MVFVWWASRQMDRINKLTRERRDLEGNMAAAVEARIARMEHEVASADERTRQAGADKQKLQFVLEAAVRRLFVLENTKQETALDEILAHGLTGSATAGTVPLKTIETMMSTLHGGAGNSDSTAAWLAASADVTATPAPLSKTKITAPLNPDRNPIFNIQVERELEERRRLAVLEEERERLVFRKERLKQARKEGERDNLYHSGRWATTHWTCCQLDNGSINDVNAMGCQLKPDPA